LEKFGIADPNFSHNGRELVKIFIKKTFHNLKGLIESILRCERENKAEISSDGILVTSGPVDLFKLILSAFNSVKHKKIKAMIENVLELCKESIIQYLIGVDCVVDVNLIFTPRALFLKSIRNYS
jgi:hypothetical protein